jgi:hypothetical protein
MKALPLLACLALLAAQALAQAAPATREATLAEIDAWRHGQLIHVTPPDPLTAEFEPRLNEIETKVKAAQGPDDLAKPQKDFTTWQHDLLMKKYVVTKIQGTTRGSLDRFSQAQREQIRTIAAQNDQLAQARLKQTPAQTFDGGGAGAGAVGTSGSGGQTTLSPVNSPATTPGLHINAAPLPPPTSKPLSLASLRDYFDHSGISEAVVKSVETIKNEVAGYGHLLSGFAGSCYYGVKWMLIKTHVLPPEVALPEEIGKIGIGSGNAYEMSKALKHNPKLQSKLHVRSLDLTTVKDTDASLIPERTMFVFDRGCAGFSSESGHIEYTLLPEKVKDLPASVFHRVGRRSGGYKPTVEANEVLACSDGCMIHSMAFLRTYGRRGCLNAYVPVSDHATAPVQMASADVPVPAEIPAAGN